MSNTSTEPPGLLSEIRANISACANAANKGGVDFTVADCDNQDTECKSANNAS